MHISSLLIVPAAVLILYTIGQGFLKFYLFRRRINKIPGPTFTIPYIGMAYKLLTLPKHELVELTYLSAYMELNFDTEHHKHIVCFAGFFIFTGHIKVEKFGHIEPYLYDRLDWLWNLASSYKDGYFRTWVGTEARVHIQKPEHIEVILRSNTEITKSKIYHYSMPWLGSGLITSTGSQWFHNRKLINPAFHFGIMEGYSEVILDKTAIFIKCIEREIKIHGDKPFDVFPIGVRAALDIICETAMGVDMHAQETVHSEYINAVHTITETMIYRMYRPWLSLDWLFYKTAQGKAYKDAVKAAHDLCTSVIKRKQQERKVRHSVNDVSADDHMVGKHRGKAFLDLLLEANEKEDHPLTIKEISDQVNTFMFAGHDTTGSMICWALFCLGNELEIQKKVHEELDDVLGNGDDQTLLKQLPNLKYLERVIKETLRLYPSVSAFSRRLTNDLKIGDYTVPADTTLIVQVYHANRDPAVWPDPLRFDPDRFLPENIKSRHPYAYVPFSAGPRNCIGQKFAIVEGKLILAKVLRKFSIKSVENHSTIKKFTEIVLRPVDGIYVQMCKRSDREGHD